MEKPIPREARKQLTVTRELELKARKALYALEDKAAAHSLKLWKIYVEKVRSLFHSWMRGHSYGRKTDYLSARSPQSLAVLKASIKHIMARYGQEAKQLYQLTKAQLFTESYYRHAWILDQITPPNIKINFDRTHIHAVINKDFTFPKLQEAEKNDKKKPKWDESVSTDEHNEQRIGNYAEGAGNAMIASIVSGIINEDSESNISGEIGDEMVGKPARKMPYIMDTLIRSNILDTIATGEEEILSGNDGIIGGLVWKTFEDEAVCEFCAENEGLSDNETDDDIPLHPRCRCRWAMLPQAWDKLTDTPLKNGGGRMYVMDKSGEVAGYVTVEFNDWIKSNP